MRGGGDGAERGDGGMRWEGRGGGGAHPLLPHHRSPLSLSSHLAPPHGPRRLDQGVQRGEGRPGRQGGRKAGAPAGGEGLGLRDGDARHLRCFFFLRLFVCTGVSFPLPSPRRGGAHSTDPVPPRARTHATRPTPPSMGACLSSSTGDKAAGACTSHPGSVVGPAKPPTHEQLAAETFCAWRGGGGGGGRRQGGERGRAWGAGSGGAWKPWPWRGACAQSCRP